VQAESLRQRAAQAAANQAALEGEVTRLTATPVISREDALQGLDRFVERCGTPAEAGVKLKRMDAHRRFTLGYALGLAQSDPELQALAAMPEEYVGLLFHLGFSEYHFLHILCGKGNPFEYELT
jgi:hypothetical protein